MQANRSPSHANRTGQLPVLRLCSTTVRTWSAGTFSSHWSVPSGQRTRSSAAAVRRSIPSDDRADPLRQARPQGSCARTGRSAPAPRARAGHRARADWSAYGRSSSSSGRRGRAPASAGRCRDCAAIRGAAAVGDDEQVGQAGRPRGRPGRIRQARVGPRFRRSPGHLRRPDASPHCGPRRAMSRGVRAAGRRGRARCRGRGRRPWRTPTAGRRSASVPRKGRSARRPARSRFARRSPRPSAATATRSARPSLSRSVTSRPETAPGASCAGHRDRVEPPEAVVQDRPERLAVGARDQVEVAVVVDVECGDRRYSAPDRRRVRRRRARV